MSLATWATSLTDSSRRRRPVFDTPVITTSFAWTPRLCATPIWNATWADRSKVSAV